MTDLHNIPTHSELETPNTETPETDVESVRKFFEIYNSIESSTDLAEMTAEFMTCTHKYNYALTESNAINGRQGKNRVTVTHDTLRLMEYSININTDKYLEERTLETAKFIFNEYLSDKQTLPSNQPKKSAAILSRVKSLLLQLFYSGNYALIEMINVPNYVKPAVDKTFDLLESIKEETLQNFINYLELTDNYQMAEIVREMGNEFWGADGTDAKVTYNMRFVDLLSTIKNPKETYEAYLKFRGEYRKTKRTILPSVIYEVFDITEDAYSRGRSNVYNELDALYADENSKKIIAGILYDD